METECVTAVIFIGICAVFDWKRMEIPSMVIYGFLVLACLSAVILKKPETGTFLYSLLPGTAMLAIGFFTRESIGYGDGLAVLVLGILLGVQKSLTAVFTGLLFSAVFSLILLILHKANGKSRIPYIPFLAAGLGVALFV